MLPASNSRNGRNTVAQGRSALDVLSQTRMVTVNFLSSCARLHPLFFVIRSLFLTSPKFEYIPPIYKMYLGYFLVNPNCPSVWFSDTETNWQMYAYDLRQFTE
jgi:hypothetical protein